MRARRFCGEVWTTGEIKKGGLSTTHPASFCVREGGRCPPCCLVEVGYAVAEVVVVAIGAAAAGGTAAAVAATGTAAAIAAVTAALAAMSAAAAFTTLFAGEIAGAAIDGKAFGGLEGDLSLLTALGADGAVHLSWGTAAATGAAAHSAAPAAATMTAATATESAASSRAATTTTVTATAAARSAATSAGLSFFTAGSAAFWFVGEAAFGVAGLVLGRVDEIGAAVAAGDGFVFVVHGITLCGVVRGKFLGGICPPAADEVRWDAPEERSAVDPCSQC